MCGGRIKQLSDYEIIKLAINGNERAFDELFTRYNGSVYYMILKVHPNETDAEDIFGKAFARLHSYRPQYAFSTWIF